MIYLNGEPVNTTIFPDNTSQVWKLSERVLTQSNYAHVVWEYSHEGEFMQLAQLKDLLDQYGLRATLRIKYLPYARQDKEITNSTTFALRTFSRLLNSLHFDEIIIMDPHSEVADMLIKNCEIRYPHDTLQKVVEIVKPSLVCYPDMGADAKYSYVYPYNAIFGSKVRNQETGYIEKYELVGDKENLNLRGNNILIVDDICDGGMTFKLLTKELKEAGAEEVNLFVTHGIFSKGLRTLRESGINRIFTQDGEAEEIQNNIAYRRI